MRAALMWALRVILAICAVLFVLCSIDALQRHSVVSTMNAVTFALNTMTYGIILKTEQRRTR